MPPRGLVSLVHRRGRLSRREKHLSHKASRAPTWQSERGLNHPMVSLRIARVRRFN